MRRARSRFGGRLEPFFRLDLVLYEGRGELLTVTSAETVAAHPRLREDARALDGAARACEAVARVFDDGDPHAGVYHLLANQLALLDREPVRATRANALAFRLKLLLAAGFAPQLAALHVVRRAASTWSASRAPRAASCARPARRAPSRSTRRRTTSSWPRSGSRWPRRRTPRRARSQQAERAILETLEHHAHLRLRPVGRG